MIPAVIAVIVTSMGVGWLIDQGAIPEIRRRYRAASYRRARRRERDDARRAAILANHLHEAAELLVPDDLGLIRTHAEGATLTQTHPCGCVYTIPAHADPGYQPCPAHELLQERERKARR
jgi:hypothetical protein